MLSKETFIGLAAALLTLLFVFLQKSETVSPENQTQNPEKQQLTALYGSPLIDGEATDEAWQTTLWKPLDQVWLGTQPSANDFSGRYKILWDENNFYILAEITDDSLIDIHADGLVKYWDDDCLEIFLDEDNSGGDHQYSHNAFAYHVALDGNVVDINPKKEFTFYNEHLTCRRKTVGKVSVWEIAMSVFDGKRFEEGGDNTPKMLKSGKKMGFMLAYCDNDRSAERENFIGSTPIYGEDKNRGWIDASVFGELTLVNLNGEK